MKKVFNCFLLSLTCSLLWANPRLDSLLQQAQAALDKEAYPQAVAAYQQILAEGLGSSELYHNLGLSYLKTKGTGMAVWCFERSLSLNHYNAAARQSLAAAQGQIIQPVQPKVQAWYAWYQGLRSVLSPAHWGLLGLVLLFSALGLFVWGRWRGKALGLWVLCLGLLALLPLFMAWQAQQTLAQKAIVVRKLAALRSGPSLNANEVQLVYGGTVVSVTAVEGDWVQVRLADGLWAWLPQESIALVL